MLSTILGKSQGANFAPNERNLLLPKTDANNGFAPWMQIELYIHNYKKLSVKFSK